MNGARDEDQGRAWRYDLFKLLVALALFIAWLCVSGWRPTVPVVEVDAATSAAPDAATAAAPVDEPPAAPALAIVARDGRLQLLGTVPDEDTRNAWLATARKAAGSPDRLDDELRLSTWVGERPDWFDQVDTLVDGLTGQDDVAIRIEDEQVLLEGSVADEAARSALADHVTAALGAPFTVINRLQIASPALALVAERAAAAGTRDEAGTPAGDIPAARSGALQVTAAQAAGAAGAKAAASGSSGPSADSAAGKAEAASSDAAASGSVGAGVVTGGSAAARAGGGASSGDAASAGAAVHAAAALGSDAAGSGSAASTADEPAATAPLAEPVSIYFAEGVSVVAPDDRARLEPLVRRVRNGQAVLQVSGYHSKSGTAQRNAEIARERALAVRDLLVGMGIAAERIVLDKPRETLGEQNDRLARRVDVSVRP